MDVSPDGFQEGTTTHLLSEVLRNAAELRSQGAEVDLEALPYKGFTLKPIAAYNDA
jgi:hypothetical protein